MTQTFSMNAIARIRSDFSTKFGVPRQSGLVNELRATIVFEPEYRNADALRGLEGFSHLWLLWVFDKALRKDGGWAPTVRPPRLGGNARLGVFATRSPFRPNPIGLSSVRIAEVQPDGPEGPTILVEGADLVDGTPILDVKPYVPYADCHPRASGGFVDQNAWSPLSVEAAPELLERVPADRRNALIAVLQQDPRPSYQEDPHRVYGFVFAGTEVRFSVCENVLTVVDVQKAPS